MEYWYIVSHPNSETFLFLFFSISTIYIFNYIKTYIEVLLPISTMVELSSNQEEWVSVKLKLKTVSELEKLKVHPRQALYEIIDDLLLDNLMKRGDNNEDKTR